MTDRPPKPRRKRQHRSKGARSGISFEKRAWGVIRELRSLLKDIQEEEGRAFDPIVDVENGSLELSIPLEARVPKNRYESATSDLVSQLREMSELHNGRPKAEGRLGSVYCFQCSSTRCAHAEPSSTIEVFCGYTPTGKPTWESLTNLLIRLGDPRIDLLYGKRSLTLAHMWTSEDLNKGLLPAFGKDDRSYRLRGQVALGHIFLPGSPSVKRVIAFQIVESRAQSGLHHLKFNLTGTSFTELAEGAETPRSPHASLYLKSRELKEKIKGLGRRWKDAQKRKVNFDIQRSCDQLMRSFRNDVQRLFRTESRRTEHAKERHQGGERPTSHAFKDLQNSTAETTYRDTTSGGVVITGPRGRIHIFSSEGKHVTSLKLDRGDIEKRLVEGRWSVISVDLHDSWKAKSLSRPRGNPTDL